MLWTVIAGAAVICSSAGLVPQVIKCYQTRETDDISFGMLYLILLGTILWFMHGVKHGDWAIITTNVLVFGLAMALFVMKRMFDKTT